MSAPGASLLAPEVLAKLQGLRLRVRHVADGLSMPMLSWHIKSTSKAADGLYVYDTVQRLNDSRFGGGDVADIRRYINRNVVKLIVERDFTDRCPRALGGKP